MREITVAVDSFKGSLTSEQVAKAFEQGFCRIFPDCLVHKVSVADGGEGTVDALVQTLGGEYVHPIVFDPLRRRIEACYGVVDGGYTAVMEMSSASGLPLLAEHERNPLHTTSYGTGEMIASALERGCRKFLVGIGGSATNDAGVGMLQALGFRFLDERGEAVEGCGQGLERIASIDESNVMAGVRESEFIVACDVENPLYGERGAAYVYAPQKGADEAMVERLDKGLKNFARVVERHNGKDISSLAGAGAAGGMGGGFVALLNARLVPGIEMVLDAIRFDQIIAQSELVITGEGRLDRQTVMGKAPSGVLRAAQRRAIPCIAIGGAIAMCEELEQSGFAALLPIVSGPIALQEAMREDVAEQNVRRTAEQLARIVNIKTQTK